RHIRKIAQPNFGLRTLALAVAAVNKHRGDERQYGHCKPFPVSLFSPHIYRLRDFAKTIQLYNILCCSEKARKYNPKFPACRIQMLQCRSSDSNNEDFHMTQSMFSRRAFLRFAGALTAGGTTRCSMLLASGRSQMTKVERVKAALHGERVDRVPFTYW